MSTFWEARIGSLMCAGGVIWGVNEMTKHFTGFSTVRAPTGGPLELCGVGILLWLHAMYRRSIRVE